jgi:hypothetical protein
MSRMCSTNEKTDTYRTLVEKPEETTWKAKM